MKLAPAPMIPFRASAARLARTEGLSLDSAAARLVAAAAGKPPADGRDHAPHARWVGALMAPGDLDRLQPRGRAQPTYDLCAYLATRCAEAYEIDDALQARIENRQGGSAFRRFAAGTDAAFGYRIGSCLVITFRGTRLHSLQQWSLTNLRAFPCRSPRRHLGFQLAWERLQRDIQEWIEANRPPGGELVLTGHSLGGAIATIAAFELAPWYPVRAVVSIGAPRTGFAEFRDLYLTRSALPPSMRPAPGEAAAPTLGAVTRRITHADDVVPRVPPDFIFRHVGEEARLDASGGLRPGASRQVLGRVFQSIDAAIGACYRGIDTVTRPIGSPVPSLGDFRIADGLLPPGAHAIQPALRMPVMRAPAADRGGHRRLLDDMVALNQRVPMVTWLTLGAVKALLIGLGVLLALVATVLTLVDFNAHRSALYVRAFRCRYPASPPPQPSAAPEVWPRLRAVLQGLQARSGESPVDDRPAT